MSASGRPTADIRGGPVDAADEPLTKTIMREFGQAKAADEEQRTVRRLHVTWNSHHSTLGALQFGACVYLNMTSEISI